jgi:hypothetical protein
MLIEGPTGNNFGPNDNNNNNNNNNNNHTLGTM